MEPRHTKTRTTARTLLSFFRSVNWCYSLFHFLTPDARIRTGQHTEVTVDGTMHTSLSRKMGREIARTIRRLPPSQRVDVSLLKRVKGLPWDGQGMVRRGGPPKLVLPRSTMAETGETLRTGELSSSGTRSSPIRPGPTDVKVDIETEWTPVARRRRFRSKTLDPAVVDATKRLRTTDENSLGEDTKMDLTDEETRKRTLVEPTGLTSLQRNTGELRTSWRRLRWMN